MPVNAFRQQAFATTLPPACKGGTTAPGLHTGAKTVLAFARSLGWLIRAFHKTSSKLARLESGYTRGKLINVNATANARLLRFMVSQRP
jgi:hypothetical protein